MRCCAYPQVAKEQIALKEEYQAKLVGDSVFRCVVCMMCMNADAPLLSSCLLSSYHPVVRAVCSVQTHISAQRNAVKTVDKMRDFSNYLVSLRTAQEEANSKKRVK